MFAPLSLGEVGNPYANEHIFRSDRRPGASRYGWLVASKLRNCQERWCDFVANEEAGRRATGPLFLTAAADCIPATGSG
jgi:hypothetical protein